ncbi:MAG: TmcC family electron transfer complex membrane anchor subunit [Desulfovibrio sp.]|uniref:TmcC family electron transfer complex membrane anchor subunit n=1 Tax=Desulfovibrio sp. 7SRBS1 TaxID=3378064 RepID=UPI003B3BEA86
MQGIYEFAVGPLAWISFLLFFGGSIYKIASWLILAKKSDPFVFKYWSWKHVFQSYAHWINPVGTMGWRARPLLTLVTFVFHICLILAPIFLMAHVVLLDQYMNLSWVTLPDSLADILTILVIVSCAYFLYRRITDRQVAFVTRPSDWVILGIVAATFVFGFLAYHQIGNYELMLVLHILAGEAFLIMIPFTRVSHMIMIPFTRGYIASEFGAVRHSRDW